MNRISVLLSFFWVFFFLSGFSFNRPISVEYNLGTSSTDPINQNTTAKELDFFTKQRPQSRDSLLRAHFTSLASQYQERLWFHTDKPYYGVGDTVWFRGYLIDASMLIPNAMSNYVYVDLFDRRRRLVKSKKIKRDSIGFANNIILPDTLSAGEYTLRAYTGWMLNFDPKNFFQLNFTVGNLYSGVNSNITYTDKHMIIELSDKTSKPYSNKKTTYKIFSKGGTLLSKGKMKTTATTGALFIPLPNKSSRDGSYVETNVDMGYRIYNRTFFIDPPEYDFDIQFLPEGGDLVPGSPQRIAFKAVRSDGYPVLVKGKIVNAAGETITSFQSEHDGMGTFLLTPQAGESYQAHTTCNLEYNGDPQLTNDSVFADSLFDASISDIKVKTSYLPTVNDQACALAVSQEGELIHYRFLGKIPEMSTLIGHTRNLYLFSQSIPSNDFSEGSVHTDSLPEGILHLMLVDSLGLPLTERLVYVPHPESRPQWSIRPDKAAYEKREKVKIDIEVDKPEFFSNYYSVSVTDRTTIYYDSLSENINSYLLVTSDLKGYIHNPGYYFIDDNLQRKHALDLVMMTHGWRRFSANIAPSNAEKRNKKDEEKFDVRLSYTAYTALKDSSSLLSYFLPSAFSPQHRVEQNQYFTGKVTTLMWNKEAKNVNVTAMTLDKDSLIFKTVTDSVGRFTIDGFDIADTTLFQFTSRGGKNDKTPYYVEVDKIYPRPLHTPFYPYSKGDIKLPYEKKFQAYLNSTNTDTLTGYTLDEVMVSGRDPFLPLRSTYGRVYDTTYISKHKSWNVYQYLARLANVGRYFREQQFTIILPGGRIQFLAQVRVNDSIIGGRQINYLKGIDMEDVKYIGVIVPEGVAGVAPSPGNATHPYLQSKIYPYRIEVILKKGAMITQPDYTLYESFGYAKHVEFYHQRYDRPWRLNSKHFDRRSTLYWNPYLPVSEEGKATVEFYADDSNNSQYEITIEGISPAGVPVFYRSEVSKEELNE